MQAVSNTLTKRQIIYSNEKDLIMVCQIMEKEEMTYTLQLFDTHFLKLWQFFC